MNTSVARRMTSVLMASWLAAWAGGPGLAHAAAAVSAASAAGADEPHHVHTTVAGDTLIGIGQRYLSDPAAWPELARLNGLRNPHQIGVGLALRVPLRLMTVEPLPATVSAVIGDVRDRGGAAVRAGQAVPEGGELHTGSDGNVTVKLVDGTVLRLRAASRLQVDESHRVRQIDSVRSGVRLEQGQVEVQAKPARGGQPGFRVGTPQGVLGVRGTEFRVSAGAAQATRAEVLEGVVQADGSTAGATQRVEAGFGVVVDNDGRVAPPVALLNAPDLSGLPALHERTLVRITLPAIGGAAGYRGQIARDPGFEQVVQELRSASAELRIAGLDDGDYVLRVRGVDAAGIEGRDADQRFRLKARPEPPMPSAPAPRAVIYGDKVEFAWSTNEAAASYRLQLARAADFSAPLRDLRGLREAAVAVDGLAPGSYAWRLASERSASDQGPFGGAQGFELRAVPATPKAAPPAVDDHNVRFAWEGAPGQTFEFQLARDPEFKTLVLERKLGEPGIELPRPGTGRFYMRLRALDADGFAGPYTSPQRFDIPNCLRDGFGNCVRSDRQPALVGQ